MSYPQPGPDQASQNVQQGLQAFFGNIFGAVGGAAQAAAPGTVEEDAFRWGILLRRFMRNEPEAVAAMTRLASDGDPRATEMMVSTGRWAPPPAAATPPGGAPPEPGPTEAGAVPLPPPGTYSPPAQPANAAQAAAERGAASDLAGSNDATPKLAPQAQQDAEIVARGGTPPVAAASPGGMASAGPGAVGGDTTGAPSWMQVLGNPELTLRGLLFNQGITGTSHPRIASLMQNADALMAPVWAKMLLEPDFLGDNQGLMGAAQGQVQNALGGTPSLYNMSTGGSMMNQIAQQAAQGIAQYPDPRAEGLDLSSPEATRLALLSGIAQDPKVATAMTSGMLYGSMPRDIQGILNRQLTNRVQNIQFAAEQANPGNGTGNYMDWILHGIH